MALDNINNRADQGGFTEVSVDSNDHWEYDWGTNSLGGRLDAGTYTVWAVDSPSDRSHLDDAEYSTISVSLGNPSISVVTPVIPGSFDLRSIPDNVSVVINGDYKGSTPLTVSGLDPGTYNITFSRFNYEKFSTPAAIESGSITEVTATLQPKTGTLVINTSPVGAQVVLDGNNLGTAPVTSTNLAAGNHTINATLDGYIPVEIQVQVIADQSVTSMIELKKPATVIPGISCTLTDPGDYRCLHLCDPDFCVLPPAYGPVKTAEVASPGKYRDISCFIGYVEYHVPGVLIDKNTGADTVIHYLAFIKQNGNAIVYKIVCPTIRYGR